MVVHPVQTAEFRQQFLRGFGADTAYTGNIVGGIPHQGLQIDQFLRLEAVFLTKNSFRIQGCRGLPRLGDHQLYMDVFVDQLQRVPVAGDNDALPALLGTNLCCRTNDIVRFPALTLIDGNVHCPQNVLHNRHLLRQFLGHTVTVGFVAFILQMAEGRAMEVEGHGNGFRLLLLFHSLQNIQKAVDGVGVEAVPCG